jgi:hypothetical protein
MKGNTEIRNLLIATSLLIIVIIILTLSPPQNKVKLTQSVTKSGFSANYSPGKFNTIHTYSGVLNLNTKFSFKYPSPWKIVSLEEPFYKNKTYAISLENNNVLIKITVYPSCTTIPNITTLKPYYIVDSKKVRTGGIEYFLYESNALVAIFYYNNNINVLLNYHKIVTNYFGHSISKNTQSEFNMLISSIKIIGGEYRCG